MKPVSNYKIVWNVPKKEGMILLEVPNGIEQIQVDSAQEATVLLQQLRQEPYLTFNKGVIATGFMPSEEGINSENTTLPTKDNLQLLDHVDATIEAALHARGIYTFRALVDMDQSVLKDLFKE